MFTNSKRGRGKNTIASRSSVRNRSSENHLSASARNPIIEELQGDNLKTSDENQNRAILTAESEADDGGLGANQGIPQAFASGTQILDIPKPPKKKANVTPSKQYETQSPQIDKQEELIVPEAQLHTQEQNVTEFNSPNKAIILAESLERFQQEQFEQARVHIHQEIAIQDSHELLNQEESVISMKNYQPIPTEQIEQSPKIILSSEDVDQTTPTTLDVDSARMVSEISQSFTQNTSIGAPPKPPRSPMTKKSKPTKDQSPLEETKEQNSFSREQPTERSGLLKLEALMTEEAPPKVVEPLRTVQQRIRRVVEESKSKLSQKINNQQIETDSKPQAVSNPAPVALSQQTRLVQQQQNVSVTQTRQVTKLQSEGAFGAAKALPTQPPPISQQNPYTMQTSTRKVFSSSSQTQQSIATTSGQYQTSQISEVNNQNQSQPVQKSLKTPRGPTSQSGGNRLVFFSSQK